MKKLLLSIISCLLLCVPALSQTFNVDQIRPSTTNTWVITTVGGHTVWAPAPGGGSCGPLGGDSTSTVCGNNNLAGSAGTNRQTFGYNNSNNLNATQSVTEGTGNGNETSPNSINITDLVAIGNANSQNLEGITSDLVTIGHQNLQSPPNHIFEAVILGEGNVNGMTNNQVNSDIIAIGDENYLNMGGIENIAIGASSLTSLNGDHVDNNNIAIGSFAMDSIDAGGGSNSITANVAIGEGAMAGAAVVSNISWGNNIAIGSNALQEVTLGDNIGIGLDADSYNSGDNNVGIGHSAMLGPVHQSSPTLSHTDVVAIGHLAAAANSTGSFNVAIGTQSGANGYDATGGGTNGNSNLTGSDNTWVGAFSGPSVTSQLSNTSAFGYQAFNTKSNQVVLGNASVIETVTNGTMRNLGTAPTSSAGSVIGTNSDGTIASLSTATSVTLTFANSGWTTSSSCVAVTSASGNAASISAISTTSVTFDFSSLTGTLYYHCGGN